MKPLIIILNLLLAIAVNAQVVEVNIEHPGAAGVNSYYGDHYCNPNEARQLVNFDIIDGDLVKRPGYAKVYTGTDSTCDGIFGYYDLDNTGHIIKWSRDNDTAYGVGRYSDGNSFTFPTDSTMRFLQFLHPVYGFDYVQFNDVLIMTSGKSHPTIYYKGKQGTLSMPAPGAPMVSVANQTLSGGPNGTYSYKLCFRSASYTDTIWSHRSKAGRQSVYAFSTHQPIYIFNVPERPLPSTSVVLPANETKVTILRNKNNDAHYYYMDTTHYHYGSTFVYKDTFSDAALGGIADTLGSDTIIIPGSPIKAVSATGNPYQTPILCAASDSTTYWAYAYIDTVLGIQSELSPYYRDSGRHDDQYNLGITVDYYTTSIKKFGRFHDGIIVYYSACKDTTRWAIWDTVYTATNSVYLWETMNPYTGWTGDTTIPPWRLTNMIPYKYITFGFSRLWAAGDEDFPSRLYYSGRTDTGAVGSWDMTFDYLSLAENDGDRIMGLSADASGIYTYKGYSIWRTWGTDPEHDMQVQQISDNRGAVNNNVIVQYQGVDYFLSPDRRIYMRSGMQVQEISQKIRNSFESLTKAELASATGVEYNGEIWFVVHDTTFVCDVTSGEYRWRKYSLNPKYFTKYDTASVSDYPKRTNLIFAKSGSDSLFHFDYGDTCRTDKADSIRAFYKSAPFLTDAYYKPLSAQIEAEITLGDSVLFELLSVKNDTLCRVYIMNKSGNTPISRTYEVALDAPVTAGFHFALTDNGKCKDLKIKSIKGRFEKFAEFKQ